MNGKENEKNKLNSKGNSVKCNVHAHTCIYYIIFREIKVWKKNWTIIFLYQENYANNSISHTCSYKISCWLVSLLDNPPNFLVGCVIQKRLAKQLANQNG